MNGQAAAKLIKSSAATAERFASNGPPRFACRAHTLPTNPMMGK
jgi:hypothetical protein